MKNSTRFLIKVAGITLTLLSLSLQSATISHQYLFNGNPNDSVGGTNGFLTGNSTNLEAPSFSTASTPNGDLSGQAMILGTTTNKKSGLALSSSIFSTTQGSLSIWFNTPSSAVGGDTDYIIRGAPITDGIVLGIQGSILATRLGNSTSVNSPTLSFGTWNNVVMTWDNTAGTGDAYLNGTSFGSYSFTAGSVSVTNLLLGGWSANDDSANLVNQYTGSLYRFETYNGILSSTEIANIQSIPEPTTSLMILSLSLLLMGFIVRGKCRS